MQCLFSGVEQTIQKFLDVAKQTECLFLQKRMQLSIIKPEQFIKEVSKFIVYGNKKRGSLQLLISIKVFTLFIYQDASELKQELIRKDELIQKHYEKLAQWQAILNRSQANPTGSGGN